MSTYEQLSHGQDFMFTLVSITLAVTANCHDIVYVDYHQGKHAPPSTSVWVGPMLPVHSLSPVPCYVLHYCIWLRTSVKTHVYAHIASYSIFVPGHVEALAHFSLPTETTTLRPRP